MAGKQSPEAVQIAEIYLMALDLKEKIEVMQADLNLKFELLRRELRRDG